MIRIHSLLFVTLLASVTLGQATRPVQTNYTQHDYLRMATQFNHRTMAEAYQTVGSHDPKWDKEAVDFLDGMSNRFAQTTVEDWYYTSASDYSVEKMLEKGQKVIDLGCNDPLVNYCCVMMLKDNGKRDEYNQSYPIVYRNLKSSNYPAMRKLSALNHFLEDFADKKGNPAQFKLAAESFDQLFVQSAETKVANPVERRYQFRMLQPYLTDCTPEERVYRMGLLQDNQKIDPWLLAMLTGEYEIKRSWDFRGVGWGSSVTEEGWKGMQEHLKLAHDKLIEAYNMQPDYPESAVAMVTVAMGDGGRLGETTEDWFNRGIAAQIDFPTCWSNYSYSLLPRWGGSHEEMYKLGCRAMETKRYDTQVPMFLITSLQDIANDREGEYQFLRVEGVWENIQHVFDGYLTDSKLNKVDNWLKSYRAAFAFRCGDYQSAHKTMDELKDQFYYQAFDRLKIDSMDAYVLCNAIANDSTENIREAYESELKEDYTESLSSYLRALRPLKPEDASYPVLQKHFLTCQTLSSYQNGEVAKLPIEEPFELVCWYSKQGKNWKVENHTLVYSGTAEEDELKFPGKFGPVSKYHMEWMWSSTGDKKKITVGLVFQAIKGPAESLAVLLNPDNRGVRVNSKKWGLHPEMQNLPIDLASDVWHTVDLDHLGDKITLKVDDKVIFSDFQNDWVSNGSSIVGLFVKPEGDSYTVKFKNLTIQKADAKQ